jgi:hypothetical protein
MGMTERRGTYSDPQWIRHRPSAKENFAALGAGLGVGLVLGGAVFYLARLFIAREPIAPTPRGSERSGPGERET